MIQKLDEGEEQNELAQSLLEIDVCYKKNKERLERDLNKMEYQIH